MLILAVVVLSYHVYGTTLKPTCGEGEHGCVYEPPACQGKIYQVLGAIVLDANGTEDCR